MQPWYSLPVIVAMGIILLMLALALIILYKIFTNEINIQYLIAEPESGGKASLARFQFLLFTFVIAGIYLLLCIESGTFVDIPPSVLGLLGISGGSYVISKGIAANVSNTRAAEDTKRAAAGVPPPIV